MADGDISSKGEAESLAGVSALKEEVARLKADNDRLRDERNKLQQAMSGSYASMETIRSDDRGRPVAKADSLAEMGLNRHAQIIRDLVRTSASSSTTNQVLHRDNVALRRRIAELEGAK